jgi:hypothetical protein
MLVAAMSRSLFYFHVVCTLPHALYDLLDRNARLIYSLLFRTAAATLSAFAHDPRHLGGELGVTAVFHTWGQTLTQHVHLRCIVTGGALAVDGSQWIAAKPGFLFPVRALARVLRAKYLAALEHAASVDTLSLPDALAPPERFRAWRAPLQPHDWVVYAKPPFAGPEQVLQYLGRYTHRVAISNDRLVALRDGVVGFRWKDYADGHRVKVMALAAEEFIRRFLLHVVPERFVRIRHFGFLANRTRQAKLDRCRQLREHRPESPPTTPESVPALMLRLIGIDIARCHVGQEGRLYCVETLRPTAPRRPSFLMANNTS